MKFIPAEIPEVVLITPEIFRDGRGYFLESYHKEKYAKGGVDAVFVQDNHSRSARRTLRGLHAQVKHAQGKLIRVTQGDIFDVAVDIRKGSPTFGRWVGARLTAENFSQVYIPEGFAHGFCVMSESAEVEYKCTDIYVPADEITVLWSDPEIGIDWPVKDPVLSEKDRKAKPLAALMDVLPVV